MLKFFAIAASVAVLFVATEATSQAASPRCGGMAAAAPAYQTAGAPSGYRTYSYQPGAGTASYGTGTMMRRASSRASYLDAGSKALGRYGK
jgi:hypothetical protein